MKIKNKGYWIEFLTLNRDMIQSNPYTKDVFNYVVMTNNELEIKYKLTLLDDCNNVFGELQAGGYLDCNKRLTPDDLNRFVVRMSIWGRERFNYEANKFHIKMYIPRADPLYIDGKIKAA